jgi:hypothetical protein
MITALGNHVNEQLGAAASPVAFKTVRRPKLAKDVAQLAYSNIYSMIARPNILFFMNLPAMP